MTTDQDGEESRKYHLLKEPTHTSYGYLGYDLAYETLVELNKITLREIPQTSDLKIQKLNEFGIYAGEYTLEVEIMRVCGDDNDLKTVISVIYNDLTLGGDIQKRNFRNELDQKEYWKCLSKIEGKGIGKGRFAQKLAAVSRVGHVPQYVKDAIENIISNVEVNVD